MVKYHGWWLWEGDGNCLYTGRLPEVSKSTYMSKLEFWNRFVTLRKQNTSDYVVFKQ